MKICLILIQLTLGCLSITGGIVKSEEVDIDGVSPAVREKSRNKISISTLMAGKHYQADYLKINQMLHSHEKTEGVEANLRAARNLLFQAEQKKFGILAKSILKALNQFLALDKIREGRDRCDWNSYAILNKNKEAVIKAPGPIERVSAVVKQVFDEHVTHCLPVYIARLNDKYSTLDAQKLAEAERYIMDLHPEGFAVKRGGWPCSITSVANERFCLTSNVRSLVSAVAEQNDPETSWLQDIAKNNDKPTKADVKRVRALVNKYLIEPCDYYMDNLAKGEDMNDNLWVPATQDISWLADNSGMKDESERLFYMVKETIKFCRIYTVDRYYRVETLVEEILKRFQ